MGVFTGTLLGAEGEREQVYLVFILSLYTPKEACCLLLVGIAWRGHIGSQMQRYQYVNHNVSLSGASATRACPEQTQLVDLPRLALGKPKRARWKLSACIPNTLRIEE